MKEAPCSRSEEGGAANAVLALKSHRNEDASASTEGLNATWRPPRVPPYPCPAHKPPYLLWPGIF